MARHRSPFVAAWAAALTVTFAACSSAPMGTREVVFSSETIEGIAPGMGRRQVIALLGLPREKSSGSGSLQVWRWPYREVLSPSGTVTFVIDEGLPPEHPQHVFVEFDDGYVVRAWFR